MHREGGAKQDLSEGAGPPTSHTICGGLVPSSHDVEAMSPPEEVRSSGPEGSREKAAPAPGAGGSGLLETVSVHQHFEGQVAA